MYEPYLHDGSPLTPPPLGVGLACWFKAAGGLRFSASVGGSLAEDLYTCLLFFTNETVRTLTKLRNTNPPIATALIISPRFCGLINLILLNYNLCPWALRGTIILTGGIGWWVYATTVGDKTGLAVNWATLVETCHPHPTLNYSGLNFGLNFACASCVVTLGLGVHTIMCCLV